MGKYTVVINFYRDVADKLAVIHGQLQDFQERAEFWTEQLRDNGNPADDLKAAMTALGTALASCVVYASEYEEDTQNEGEKTDTSPNEDK